MPMHRSAVIVRCASRLAVAAVAVSALTGCLSKPVSRVHYVGPEFGPKVASTPARSGGQLRLTTLGAGDALGRSIHQNDVYLAYLAEVAAPLRVTGVADAP